MDPQWPGTPQPPALPRSGPPPLPPTAGSGLMPGAAPRIPGGGPPPLPPPSPFDGWWTVLWGMLAMGVWMGAQGATAVAYLIFTGALESLDDPQKLMESIMVDGDFLGLLTVIGAVVGCPVCYYLGSMRAGFTGSKYLALTRPKVAPLVLWLALTGALALVFHQIAPYFQSADDSEAMVEALRNMNAPLLLLAGLVVGAPFVEEFIFRGFMFRGLRSSALGLHGTVLVTSVVFTALHLQYGLFGLTYIFILGVSFGYARHLTGSLWVPIGMHALNNAIASYQLFSLAE